MLQKYIQEKSDKKAMERWDIEGSIPFWVLVPSLGFSIYNLLLGCLFIPQGKV